MVKKVRWQRSLGVSSSCWGAAGWVLHPGPATILFFPGLVNVSLCPPSPCWEIPEAPLLASQGFWVTRLSLWPLTPVVQRAGRNVGDVYLGWDWWCPGGSLYPSLYFLLSLLSAAEWCEGKALPGVIPVTGDPPAWISSWAQAHLWTDSLGLCQKVSGLSWLEGNERERAIDWPRVWVRSENALVQSSTSQSSPSDSQLSGVARQRGHSVIGNGPPLPAPPPSTSP